MMPIFEFRCKKCGNKFEIYLGQVKCPVCGSEEAEKAFSSFAIHGKYI